MGLKSKKQIAKSQEMKIPEGKFPRKSLLAQSLEG